MWRSFWFISIFTKNLFPVGLSVRLKMYFICVYKCFMIFVFFIWSLNTNYIAHFVCMSIHDCLVKQLRSYWIYSSSLFYCRLIDKKSSYEFNIENYCSIIDINQCYYCKTEVWFKNYSFLTYQKSNLMLSIMLIFDHWTYPHIKKGIMFFSSYFLALREALTLRGLS